MKKTETTTHTVRKEGNTTYRETTTTEYVEEHKRAKVKEDVALKYLKVLEKKFILDITFEDDEDSSRTLQISKESFDHIMKVMPEKKKYSVNHVIFTSITEETIANEKRTAFMKKMSKRIIKDVYYQTYSKPALKLSLPSTNFSVFDRYSKHFKNHEEQKKNLKVEKKPEKKVENSEKEVVVETTKVIHSNKVVETTKVKTLERVLAPQAQVEETNIQGNVVTTEVEEQPAKLRSKPNKPNKPKKPEKPEKKEHTGDEKGESKKEKKQETEEKKEAKKEVPRDTEKKQVTLAQKIAYTPHSFVTVLPNGKIQQAHKRFTHPRHYGKDAHHCRVCNNTHGLIRKYGIDICRRCFRERADLLGFKQTK